jgi:hypothetical protein
MRQFFQEACGETCPTVVWQNVVANQHVNLILVFRKLLPRFCSVGRAKNLITRLQKNLSNSVAHEFLVLNN